MSLSRKIVKDIQGSYKKICGYPNTQENINELDCITLAHLGMAPNFTHVQSMNKLFKSVITSQIEIFSIHVH